MQKRNKSEINVSFGNWIEIEIFNESLVGNFSNRMTVNMYLIRSSVNSVVDVPQCTLFNSARNNIFLCNLHCEPNNKCLIFCYFKELRARRKVVLFLT